MIPDKKLTKGERGYYAGFIDADGTITIRKRWKHNKRYLNYFPRVMFANYDRPALEKFKNRLKWNTKIQPKYLHTDNREEIIWFLEQIKDYLVIKKDLAEIVLEFCLSRREQIQQKGKKNCSIH